jgi:hypothetical protein
VLKERQFGQGRSEELAAEDLKAKLLESEREHQQKRKREGREVGTYLSALHLHLSCMSFLVPDIYCYKHTLTLVQGPSTFANNAEYDEEEEVDHKAIKLVPDDIGMHRLPW